MRTNLTLSSFLTVSALLGVAVPAAAQTQAVLEKAFEGREVVVLMDMPASHSGVDSICSASRRSSSASTPAG